MFKLLILLIGVFIGWNFPQPEYAKRLQDLVINKFKEVTDQLEDKKDDSNK